MMPFQLIRMASKVIGMVVVFAGLTSSLFAEQKSATAIAVKSTMSAQQIVDRASLSAYYGGQDGRSLARMKIVDANGRQQVRQFTLLRKDDVDGGEQKFLVVFSRPTDVKGTVFMVHKKPQADDDRWLYLPALDLVKRISAGDQRTSFVGAHYFYEDVSGRSPTLDNHSLLEETERFYVLEHQPKDAAVVEFSKYQTWIDKNNFLPMKIVYFNSANVQYRLIEALAVEDVQGIATVTRSKVSNLTDSSYTLMEFKNMAYDIGLDDDVFNERSIRNPPQKWLKID